MRSSDRRPGIHPSLPITAVGLVAAAALFTPTAVTAAPIVSQAKGQLITTSLLDSSTAATLKGATAVNTGGADVVADAPLAASVPGELAVVTAGPWALFGAGNVIQLHGTGQFARANADGSSLAYSGAVSTAAALIGVDTVTAGPDIGSPALGDTAQIVLADDETDPIALSIGVEALAASATQSTAGAQSGDYRLGSTTITVDGALLNASLTEVFNRIESANIQIVTLGLPAPSNPFNPQNTVTVGTGDLAAEFPSGDLDDLPPNTSLTDVLAVAAVTKILSLIDFYRAEAVAGLSGANLVAVNAIITSLTAVLAPTLAVLATTTQPQIDAAIRALVQLTVNRQTVVAGAFTETALHVGLGPAGSFAAIGLASASVGPNGGPIPSAPSAVSGTLASTGSSTAAALALAAAAVIAGVAAAAVTRRRIRRSESQH